MSGTSDAAGALHLTPLARRTPLKFGRIVVVGGGCYGGYYVRQLGRARAAGAVEWRELLVVDRNPECALFQAVSRGEVDAAPVCLTREWDAFFQAYLDGAADGTDYVLSDAIVPSPLMPHLLFHWVRDRATRRWPGREIATAALDRVPPTPWERAGEGAHYVSFATWMCPINCIEPRLCPKTRGERNWSMPAAIRSWADAGANDESTGTAVLQCTHRVYGVGMIDVQDVIDADRLVASLADGARADVLVVSASHCHGAIGRLLVGAPVDGAARGSSPHAAV